LVSTIGRQMPRKTPRGDSGDWPLAQPCPAPWEARSCRTCRSAECQMTDLILAIAHHLCVFTVAALLVAEIAVLRPGIAGDRIRQIARIDTAYGAFAALVIVVGVLRVIYGDKGADYYIHNSMFWLKMAAFALVGLLSLPPTLEILGWGRKLNADASF